jgi:hypothetical protein
MIKQGPAAQELAKGAGVLALHLMGIAAGLVLMVVGLAMGVSMVLLPVGVPVGLFGLLMFLWGLFGWAGAERAPAPQPTRAEDDAR